MTWKRLKVNRNAEGAPWVSIGVHARPGGYTQIKLTLSATVAEFLGVGPGDQLHLERGTGDHQGWVRMYRRLVGEAAGHTLAISSRHADNGNVSARVSGAFLALDTKHKTERCPDVVPAIEEVLVLLQDGHTQAPYERRVVSVELPQWASQNKVYDPWQVEEVTRCNQ